MPSLSSNAKTFAAGIALREMLGRDEWSYYKQPRSQQLVLLQALCNAINGHDRYVVTAPYVMQNLALCKGVDWANTVFAIAGPDKCIRAREILEGTVFVTSAIDMPYVDGPVNPTVTDLYGAWGVACISYLQEASFKSVKRVGDCIVNDRQLVSFFNTFAEPALHVEYQAPVQAMAAGTLIASSEDDTTVQ